MKVFPTHSAREIPILLYTSTPLYSTLEGAPSKKCKHIRVWLFKIVIHDVKYFHSRISSQNDHPPVSLIPPFLEHFTSLQWSEVPIPICFQASFCNYSSWVHYSDGLSWITLSFLVEIDTSLTRFYFIFQNYNCRKNGLKRNILLQAKFEEKSNSKLKGKKLSLFLYYFASYMSTGFKSKIRFKCNLQSCRYL